MDPVNTPTLEASQEAVVPPAPPSSPRKKPFGKILLGIVFALLAGLSWVYVRYLKPFVVAGRALNKLSSYDTAQISYSTASGKTKVVADYAGEKEVSQFTFASSELSEKGDRNIELQLRADDKDFYMHGTYSNPDEVTQFASALYPRINTTKTFGMAKSLWTGEKWLHISLPQTSESKEKDKDSWKEFTSTDEGKKFAKDWVLAVRPGKVVRNFEFEGQKYTKVSFGFRKDKLVDAINDIKDLDVKVEVDKINSLVKAVKSTDGWDKELVQVLVDTDGVARVMSFKIPEIDEKTLDESIKEGVGEGAQAGFAATAADSVKNLIWGKAENSLVDLGTVRFDKLDDVKPASKPTNIVEGVELMTVAQQELGPILAAILSGGSTVQQPRSITPYTTPSAKPRTASCIQYKIREGEFASDKCYSKSDYDDLMYYMQRYNSAIFAYNGAASQANVTCNGFSENFKQQCEVNKQEMQKAESDKQNYANMLRAIIARGQ